MLNNRLHEFQFDDLIFFGAKKDESFSLRIVDNKEEIYSQARTSK